jgi:uncharacterized protein (DUF433 family)
MTTSTQSYDYDRLTRPRYSYADADRIVRVSRGTSSRWVKGYWYWHDSGERVRLPAITSESGPEAAVSFFDLIGVVAIRELRKANLSLPQVRRVVTYCQRELGLEYPLVTETFRTDGREVFIEAEGHLLDVGRRGGQQVWDEVVAPFLQTIDYHHEFARRWWPLGRDVKVVVDPRYGFGLPVIAGSGVRTEIVAERHRAGDANGEIAYDFGVTVPEVEDALRYEELPSAA